MTKYKLIKGHKIEPSIDIPKEVQDILDRRREDYYELIRFVCKNLTTIYKGNYNPNNKSQVKRNKDALYKIVLFNLESEELLKDEISLPVYVENKPLKVALNGIGFSIKDILEAHSERINKITDATIEWYQKNHDYSDNPELVRLFNEREELKK